MDKIEQLVEQKIQQALQNYNFGSLQSTRHTHNGVDSQKLQPKYFINYPLLISSNFVVVATSGTAPVNVFPNGLPQNINYLTMISISQDTTSSVINLYNGTQSIGILTKSTTAGAMVGTQAVGNTIIQGGSPVTVVSNNAGNAIIIIFYTVL
jgi:hypothetical protein